MRVSASESGLRKSLDLPTEPTHPALAGFQFRIPADLILDLAAIPAFHASSNKMDILGGERITVIQRGSGSRDKAGRYRIDPGSVVEIENVKGTINPVPGEVLETLPEGERQG